MNLKEIQATLTRVSDKGELLVENVYDMPALLSFRKINISALLSVFLFFLLLTAFFVYYSFTTWPMVESVMSVIAVCILVIMEYFIYHAFKFWFEMKYMLPKIYSKGFADYYFSLLGTRHEIFVPFVDITGLYVDVDRRAKRQLAGFLVKHTIIRKSKKDYSKEKIEKKIKYYSSGIREDYLYITARKGVYLFLIKHLLKDKNELIRIFKDKGIESVSYQKAEQQKSREPVYDVPNS